MGGNTKLEFLQTSVSLDSSAGQMKFFLLLIFMQLSRGVKRDIFYCKHKAWFNFKRLQCSPANPAQAGGEAVGLADLSGLPSSFCVLVGE